MTYLHAASVGIYHNKEYANWTVHTAPSLSICHHHSYCTLSLSLATGLLMLINAADIWKICHLLFPGSCGNAARQTALYNALIPTAQNLWGREVQHIICLNNTSMTVWTCGQCGGHATLCKHQCSPLQYRFLYTHCDMSVTVTNVIILCVSVFLQSFAFLPPGFHVKFPSHMLWKRLHGFISTIFIVQGCLC